MDQQHDSYEAYLNGTMVPDERGAFEARLMEDPGMAREFGTFRSMVDLVRTVGEHRLRSSLAAIHGSLHAEGGSPTRTRVIRMNTRRWLAIAASLLLGISVAYYLLGTSKSPQDLYAENMTPYSGPDRTRSAGADPWSRFADLYNTGEYDEAITELDAVQHDRVPGYLVAFYRGQCLLLKREPDPRASLTEFQKVLDVDNDLQSVARWYMGLAALKSNDPAMARSHFEALKTTDGYKREEAAHILRELPDA